jgi:hypothetical protein
VYDARRIRTEQQSAEDRARQLIQGSFGPFKRIGFGGQQDDTTLTQARIGGLGTATGVVYQSGSVQNVTVTISGGDLNQVKAVLAQYLGASALQRSTVSTAKV